MTFLKNIFNKPSKVDKTSVVKPSYYETHKDRIYPWVKVTFDDGIPAQIELRGEDELISKTWLGELLIPSLISILLSIDNRWRTEVSFYFFRSFLF